MFQTRKNMLNRLEEKINRLNRTKDQSQQIAELELIIAAEMATLMILRTLRAEPFSNRTARMGGLCASPRGPYSQSELDRKYGDDHRTLEARIGQLRTLTGDDDVAWEVRIKRLRSECESMLPDSPKQKRS